MPASKAPVSKKPPLTLAQLATYDDILTDALVDHVFYWTKIPKNRSSYHPSRGVRENEIGTILQEEVVLNKDVQAAEQRLLATDGLRRYYAGLKTDKEKDDFRRHLRRYVQIYLPDCPWEVNSTNRYTIVSHEASITARRPIKRNESIKYLSGIQVNITPDEENEMAVRKKDFSIVVSSRSKCASLFMGPARFANHDCDANAKLMTTSHAGIEIIATKAINVGDEITVTYGENYFGEANCECLCQSCEDALKNGWAQEDGTTMIKRSIEEQKEDSYSLRRRRRDDSVGGSSRTPSVNPSMRPVVRKSRSTTSRFGNKGSSSVAETPTREAETPRVKKRTVDAVATPPITPAKKLKYLLEPSSAGRAVSRSSSVSGSISSAGGETLETDATSPEKDSPDPMIPTPQTDSGRFTNPDDDKEGSPEATADETITPALGGSSLDFASKEIAHVADTSKGREVVDLSAMSIPAILNTPLESESESVAPIAVSIETVEDINLAESDGPGKRKKYQRRVFIKQSTPPARQRKRGDYVLTPLLLSEPEMAWIQCSNCPTYFVQQNAYFTRSCCPRCERHSKLYGYIWPKTEKTGPSDKEERVLDHRTVHRFLDPDDERRVRGRKNINKEELETEEPEEPPRGRTIGRAASRGGRGGKPTQREIKSEPKVEEDISGLRRSGRARRVSSRFAGS